MRIILFAGYVAASTPLPIRGTRLLGPQESPDLARVSRDGGVSVLINDRSVWLYDDTECLDTDGKQLSFLSNSATYVRPSVSKVQDFGIKEAGTSKQKAILADVSKDSGSWIPFTNEELEYNREMQGHERLAIWPGTAPTPISPTQAFLFAPLVYVDMQPQNAVQQFQGRGMALISITAPASGPKATRQGDIVIPGTEIGYGGFGSLVGRKDMDDARNVYLFGAASNGLQLARVDIWQLTAFDQYEFWHAQNRTFSSHPAPRESNDTQDVYIQGSFSSSTIFFSPYFSTFLLIYFTRLADSTFYVRFLDLADPLEKDEPVWQKGGRAGAGIDAEDAEALLWYAWSDEQVLYASRPAAAGYNYAGAAHPEFFSRQYFRRSVFPAGTSMINRLNPWIGASEIAEIKGVADGRNLLLSWSAQIDVGVYEIQLAILEFGDHDHSATHRETLAESDKDATRRILSYLQGGTTRNTRPSLWRSFLWLTLIFWI